MSTGVRNFALALALYCLLGVMEDGLGAVTASVIGLVVKPSFNNPITHTSSLRDFWSFRWNRHVASLLRELVYEPVVSGVLVLRPKKKYDGAKGRPSIGRRIVGTLLTFFASGVMHEIHFLYMTHGFAGDWLIFFTLQGFFVVVEHAARKFIASRPTLAKWLAKVPKVLRILMTISFLLVTGSYHYFPPVRRSGLDKRVVSHVASMMAILK